MRLLPHINVNDITLAFEYTPHSRLTQFSSSTAEYGRFRGNLEQNAGHLNVLRYVEGGSLNMLRFVQPDRSVVLISGPPRQGLVLLSLVTVAA